MLSKPFGATMLPRLVFVLSVLSLISSYSFASEEVTVCAKYQTESGWSDGYKVNAYVLKGSELNSATNSFDYTSFSTYTVIFWSDDQATIIEMDSPYLSYVGTEGTDQIGRIWKVAKTSVCY